MGLVDVGSSSQQIRVYIDLHNRNATDGSSEGAVQNQLIVWANVVLVGLTPIVSIGNFIGSLFGT
jgi:hypothetical protein